MWREIKRPPVSAQQAAFLRRLKLRRYTIYTIQILLLVGFFLLWEVAARKGWVDAFLFSQPTEIWATAVEMAENGMLWKHAGGNRCRLCTGYDPWYTDCHTALVESDDFRCGRALSGSSQCLAQNSPCPHYHCLAWQRQNFYHRCGTAHICHRYYHDCSQRIFADR